ncbi:LysR family transcriptional regulator [Alginatibacterium sediminis]|uniref:LysR family transcriptional regulator n=1 Tax=Alginatibacterium sediminis TaxID=2164068 RepID=A0A420EL30_9ALTE|nr:LysR family transcriptional regulator [Alginatibacterium sediminis]RKF21441.1 LysR family transcriptional regulator [Alginatibacterium sediminis]
MSWSFEQLNSFVNAVNLGSFSAAARRLGKAQSRVSTDISNLEADLGFELFDRSQRLPQLTDNGKEMFVEAKAVLSQCQRLNSRALSVSEGNEAAIVFAIDEAVPITAFESFFEKISDQFPLLKLTIINGSQYEIAQWVDDGICDLGILFYQRQLAQSLEFTSIGSFKQTLIVGKNHPLSATPAPNLTQLNQYRQLVIWDLAAKGAQAISAKHWHIDSFYYIAALVTRGLGWALVPEHIARSPWVIEGIDELSCEYIPDSLLVEMGIVIRRDTGIGPIMQWMYTELEHLFD